MSRLLVKAASGTRVLQAPDGAILLDVLRAAGCPVTAPCGGNGTCGKCRVGLARPEGSLDTVLACRFPVTGDLTVILDAPAGGTICTDSAVPLPLAPGKTGFGAAVDLGTTTVALKLYDLSTGAEQACVSGWNAQSPYGADVISRCQYCMERGDGLDTLRALIREQIGALLTQACEISSVSISSVKEIYLAGNTVMQHILSGISPASIAVAPFRPATLFEDGGAAELNGIPLRLAPCVSGYVGGDITAGLLACGLHEKPGRHLFLDIGTNGEMALGGRDGFLCCAAASGPAFEGAGITCGMAGTEGAVSAVTWKNRAPALTVVGGGTPKGICGSGLLDAVAMLLALGIVDETGYLQPPDDLTENFAPWLDEDEDGNGIFYLTADRSIYLTARDIRSIQLAKAAIGAGISTLLDAAGITLSELDGLYLAGGFGTRLNPDSAVAVGLLPRAMRGKLLCVGNASLSGAAMSLSDDGRAAQLADIQRKCTYLELSGNGVFNALFPEHMTFDEEELPWK